MPRLTGNKPSALQEREGRGKLGFLPLSLFLFPKQREFPKGANQELAKGINHP